MEQVFRLGLQRLRRLWLGEASGTQDIKEEGAASVKGPLFVVSGDEGAEGTACCFSGLGKLRLSGTLRW